MNEPDLKQTYLLASQAMEMEPGEREAFLVEACGADEGLLGAVKEFLAKAEGVEDGGRYEGMVEGVRGRLEDLVEGSALPVDWMPERVGLFRVVRRIGEGGMGIVYEGIQEAPERRVALKVMNPQMVSPETTRRFRLEAEALGRLQHPGIAQIFAADSADLGFGEQPYLAMEFIDGAQLLEFVHAEGLGVAERVELLASLCDAVEHAHGRGIVHRDIKPDNVLVDGEGRAKLLDFGIAQVTGDVAWAQSVAADTGQLMGTMAYMAPEQVKSRREEVGPRTDVYALGAVGFEMLSARLPREIAGLSITQAIERIGSEDARRLRSVLPGCARDLDTVFGKALESRPKDRYLSAAALAADLRRYMRDQPIAARAPSALDWMWKFCRRNRVLVGGVLATVFALVLGVILTSQQAGRAQRQSVLYRDARDGAQRELYYSEMQLASAAAMTRLGFGRARQLAGRWDPGGNGAGLCGWEWEYFDSLNKGAPLALAAGKLPMGADWHPDGKRVAVVHEEGVSIYDGATGEELLSLVYPEAVAGGIGLSVLWSPDGSLLSVVGFGFSLAFEVQAEKALWFVEGDYAAHQAWAADGASFWGVDRGVILRLDARTGEVLARSELERDVFAGLSFDPLRSRIYCSLNRLVVLDSETLQEIHREEEQVSLMTSIAVHPTREVVAMAVKDNSYRIWNGEDPAQSYASARGSLPLRHASFDPSGKMLAVASEDGSVEVWDWEARRLLRTFPWHETDAIHTAWSSDGVHLLTVGGSQAVQIHSLESNVPYLRIPALARTKDAHHAYLSWSSQGDRILACDGGSSEVWDARRNRRLLQVDGGQAHFNPTGDWFVNFDDGSWHIWDARTGEELASLPFDRRLGQGRFQMHPRRNLWVTQGQGALFVFDAEDAKAPRMRELIQGDGDSSILFHPQRGTVFTRFVAHEWTEIDVDSGAILQTIHAEPAGDLHALEFESSGRWLAAGYSDGVIRILDGATFQPVAKLEGHTSKVRGVAWSPDGMRLASASQDLSLKIWDVANRELAASFPTAGVLHAVRWRADGKAVAALGLDRVLHIWDAAFAD